MRLSKSAYFFDFALYAAVFIVLLAVALRSRIRAEHIRWSAAAMIGFAAWSLSEYLLHRFTLHGRSWISAMHAEHHRFPRAYIGTPTWISLSIFGGIVFVPAWWSLSLSAAAGLTAGLCLAYLWYGIVHHVIHHRRPKLLAACLSGAAHRHFRHHDPASSGNFGVTTPIWDHIFGTCLEESRAGRLRTAKAAGRRRVVNISPR